MTALSILADKSFKVKLPAKKWKEAFHTFTALQKQLIRTKKGSYDFEIPVKVTADYLQVKSMDASHICMLEYLIKKEECLAFSCTREIVFGLEFHRFLKVLHSLRDSEIVTLDMHNEQLQVQSIQSLDDTKTLRKNYKIKIQEITLSASTPKVELPSKFEIHKSTLQNIVRSMRSTGIEYFDIVTEPNKVVFQNQDAEIVLPDWDVYDSARAGYSGKYISEFLEAIKADVLTLEYGTKIPLKISAPGTTFWIAPRVRDEEEKKAA